MGIFTGGGFGPGFIFGGNTGRTLADLQRQRSLAQALLAQSQGRIANTLPQGMAQFGQALGAWLRMGAADRAITQRKTQGMDALKSALFGQPTQPASTAPVQALTAVAASTDAVPGLFHSESGNNFKAQNNVSGAGGRGHFGRGQFSRGRLAEAAKALGLEKITPHQFIQDSKLQKRVEDWHFSDIDDYARRNGIADMYGQTIGGVMLTPTSFRAMAHLGGKAGARKFIETGGRYNPSDAYGTSLRDYGTRFVGGWPLSTQAPVPTPQVSVPPQPNEFWQNVNAPENSPDPAVRAAAQQVVTPTGAARPPDMPDINEVAPIVPSVGDPSAKEKIMMAALNDPLVRNAVQNRIIREGEEMLSSPPAPQAPAGPTSIVPTQGPGTPVTPPVAASMVPQMELPRRLLHMAAADRDYQGPGHIPGSFRNFAQPVAADNASPISSVAPAAVPQMSPQSVPIPPSPPAQAPVGQQAMQGGTQGRRGGPFATASTERLINWLQQWGDTVPHMVPIIEKELMRRATPQDPKDALELEKLRNDIAKQKKELEKAPERKMIQDANKRWRYPDTGEYVFDIPEEQLKKLDEYGLQGIPAVDENGNPILLQLSKSGKAKATELPPGVQLRKPPIVKDLGTSWAVIDPITQETVRELPKDLRGAEREKTIGKQEGEVKSTLSAARISADETLKKIQQLIDDPNLSKITGWQDWLPDFALALTQGKATLGLRRRVDQLRGSAFMEAYQALKGGGPITDIEGTKAENALARLDAAQSDEDYLQALVDFADAVETGFRKLQANAGEAPANDENDPFGLLQ